MAEGINDHDRLRRYLEQQPIACFGMPQPDIIPFHRLLRIDQPLLHRRERPQIAADHHKAVVPPDIDRRVKHRNILPPQARHD